MRSVVNSGEAQVKKISTVVLDISYHWALITAHLTSQKVQQPAVMSKTREVIIREASHSGVNMRLHVYVTEKPDPSGRRG